eukprot:4595560-Amphidinium_carterae.1
MQLTSSGKLPLEIPAAVEQIMRERDCLKTFDDFVLALRHRIENTQQETMRYRRSRTKSNAQGNTFY